MFTGLLQPFRTSLACVAGRVSCGARQTGCLQVEAEGEVVEDGFLLLNECGGMGGGFAVGDVVAQLEEATVVEAEVLVLRISKGGGGGEEAGCFAVDDF